jgi:hypothetical protein
MTIYELIAYLITRPADEKIQKLIIVTETSTKTFEETGP